MCAASSLRMTASLQFFQSYAAYLSAAEFIHAAGFDGVWDRIAIAAKEYMTFRVREEIEIETMVTDYEAHLMGKSAERPKGLET